MSYHSRRPEFSILLKRLPKYEKPTERAIDSLISSLPTKDYRIYHFRCGPSVAGPITVAKITFSYTLAAADAFVDLWRRRLDGFHLLVPELYGGYYLCWKVEILERVKKVFAEYVDKIMDGEAVNKLKKRAEELEKQIKDVSSRTRQPRRIGLQMEMMDEKERLHTELNSIRERLIEFKNFMECVASYINKGECGKVGSVLNFRSYLDMNGLVKIHSILIRECKRLEEGLPIYAWRRKIIDTVFHNQVTVMIGETGSGKSTQLVQFIADSGIANSESIICTQPRKVAAVSVAQRAGDESIGCYDEDNSIISYPTYFSSQSFKSKVIFMTDHCLLQHYMGKKGFKGISCIIVDEAHERSLNTDLLLALIKKELLYSNLRVVITSATADASKLADYFCSCETIYVKGRNFNVDVKYVDDVSAEAVWSKVPRLISDKCSSYVSDVVMMARIIHRTEKAGGILAFLTSQIEVEWACENFGDPSAVVLPMHGKLSYEDQARAICNYPGKRKVIFATNVAETSLTIPDVKYVIDSGMVKEKRFEPSTGMNVLKVDKISQSSANQRKGRAGRTGPGICYRLYSEDDFKNMKKHQEPEILKVHLGIAILRILALDMKNVQDFDFVDAPNQQAVEKAIQSLLRIGAIVSNPDGFVVTDTGQRILKLDIEPQLAKIVLDSFSCGLRKEGLVLAALMANASNIFCRVGSEDDKHKADCLKLPFCHSNGDLFTLMAVYKEWEEMHENRNSWCWQNCINAKSMRRCHDTILELEKALRHELNTIVPSYWYWDPNKSSGYEKSLKKIILSSLVENAAMYSGSEQIGYVVALSGKHIRLHPSCSLLAYGEKPTWVVFSEILSMTSQYLTCVTAVDYNDLINIPSPLFDVKELESQRMSTNIISSVGINLLRRFCGKSSANLESIISYIRKETMVDSISIEVEFGRGEIHIVSPLKDMKHVSSLVSNYLESELKWLKDECIEKNLFNGSPGSVPSVALFGSGAEIKHLELDKRYLTVEVFHPNALQIHDKELLRKVKEFAPGVANFYKCAGTSQEGTELNKWGKITFLSPELAENALAELNKIELYGSLLKVVPLSRDNQKRTQSVIKARVCWPRRRSKGVALLKCLEEDVEQIVRDCSELMIGGQPVLCESSQKSKDGVFIARIPKDVSEAEIYDAVASMTRRRIFGVSLLKHEPAPHAPEDEYAAALTKEIIRFMPNKHGERQNFRVEVFRPEFRDHMMKAVLTFDRDLHLEAAMALHHLEGKVLTGCYAWQKIQCQHEFRSYVSIPPRIYDVIREELDFLIKGCQRRRGVTCELERPNEGARRVKISANATKIVADMRKPFEQLIRGRTVINPSIGPSLLQLLLTRDGFQLLKSVERETGTCIIYDRQNLSIRIFGPQGSAVRAEGKIVRSLLAIHEKKPLEIRLRGHALPSNLMKELVKQFGADFRCLKQKFPGVDLSLSTLRHILYVRGGTKEQKQKIEEIVSNVSLSLVGVSEPNALLSSASTSLYSSECPICLCELDDPYKLEACGHSFCRSCLVEQCESAARSHDGFPLKCTKAGCTESFLLVDLKSLLPKDKMDELFRASLHTFVASNDGKYHFCPSPDCPSIYHVADKDSPADARPFVCGACMAETCRRCHLEYHPFISCEEYKKCKEEPVVEWRKNKGYVKDCPTCKCTIEKNDGCNHVECRCGSHICFVCLKCFDCSDDCYAHIRSEGHDDPV